VAFINLLAGIAFAWIARDRIRADGPFAPQAFLLVALHAGMIVAPLALYFYLVHPEWAWLYLVDPAKLSGLAVLPLVVGHAGLVGAGWYLAAYLIRTDRKKPLLYTAAGTTLVTLIVIAISFGRLSHAATYPGWQLGAKVGLFDVELGYSVTVGMLGLAGSIAYVAVALVRDRRRVRARG
jgi:hypothetical protein